MALTVRDWDRALGRGCYSTVYSGTLKGGRVAVKRARGTKEQQFAFNEIRQLGKLHHCNIIELLGVFWNSRGTLDIVLELAEGGNLAEALEDAREREEQWKRSTIYQIANGLAFMHGVGIQHRDLKPKNILFKNPSQDRVLIADFGMATSEAEMSDAGARIFHRLEVRFTKASDVHCLAGISCCIAETENPTSVQDLERIRARAFRGKFLRREGRRLFVVGRALHEHRAARPTAEEFRDAFANACPRTYTCDYGKGKEMDIQVESYTDAHVGNYIGAHVKNDMGKPGKFVSGLALLGLGAALLFYFCCYTPQNCQKSAKVIVRGLRSQKSLEAPSMRAAGACLCRLLKTFK